MVLHASEEAAKTVEEMCSAVVDLISNPAKRYEMGRNGLKTVTEGGYTVQHFIKKYEMLYDDLRQDIA